MTASKPSSDPHALHEAIERFNEFRGKKVVGISATPKGVVLRFEGGVQLGPISRFTAIEELNLLRVKR